MLSIQNKSRKEKELAQASDASTLKPLRKACVVHVSPLPPNAQFLSLSDFPLDVAEDLSKGHNPAFVSGSRLQPASDDWPPAVSVDHLANQFDSLCISKDLNVWPVSIFWTSWQNQRPKNVLVRPDPLYRWIVKLFFVDEDAGLRPSFGNPPP